MSGQVAARENAAVHAWMQGLHAAVEHLRKSGVVGHVRHRHAGIAQERRGPAGGEQHHSHAVQKARKFDDSTLVGDADKGSPDDGHWTLMVGGLALVGGGAERRKPAPGLT